MLGYRNPIISQIFARTSIGFTIGLVVMLCDVGQTIKGVRMSLDINDSPFDSLTLWIWIVIDLGRWIILRSVVGERN